MLSFKEIIDRLENPSLIAKENIPELVELSKRYAYSPIFPMLLLKGLTNYNAVHYEEELKKYAYKIPDRAQLYDLLQFVEKKETQKIIIPLEEKTEEESAEEVPVETIEKEEVEEIVETKSDISFLPEKKENKISALEKEILAHAISSSISLEIEEASALEEDQYDFSKLKKLEIKEEKEEKEEVLESLEIHWERENEEQAEFSSINTFTGWLQITDKIESSSVKEEKRKENQDKNIEKENILEKKEERTEFYSSRKKASESIDESRIPVSETLAKIYALQGNYPMAIEAYGKLILKFPEKKSFFVLQIESLKNKLK